MSVFQRQLTFLDETLKKPVKVRNYFKGTEKFIRTNNVFKQQVRFNLLDKKKRFCLRHT